MVITYFSIKLKYRRGKEISAWFNNYSILKMILDYLIVFVSTFYCYSYHVYWILLKQKYMLQVYKVFILKYFISLEAKEERNFSSDNQVYNVRIEWKL